MKWTKYKNNKIDIESCVVAALNKELRGTEVSLRIQPPLIRFAFRCSSKGANERRLYSQAKLRCARM